MKLGTKITLGFASLIIIALLLGSLAIWKMSVVKKDALALANDFMPTAAVANEVERASLQTMYEMRGYALSEDTNYLGRAYVNLAEVKGHLDDTKKLAAKTRNAQLAFLNEAVQRAETKTTEYQQLVAQTVSIVTTLDHDRDQMNAEAQAYMKACSDYLTVQDAKLRELLTTFRLRIDGRGLTAAIDDSVRRVQSMALVHEQLYRSKDLARVDFGDYMQTLVEQLSHATHAQARGIRVEADVLQAPMGIETAIPCGLIVSELVSNAFKHAFTGRDRGTVMVRFRAGPAARHWVLTVADDGVGLPADIDVHRSRSLGLRLIATLTEQLSGTLDIARGQGTAFTVTFLDEDKAK